MTFVATALGPRVRPAAVAAGPRGSAHGGTVGAIATAANRQRCLRRHAPGATIARLDARHTLGVGAGALRRARGDATSRGARACRLQVNAHGSHGTSLAPSETTSTRPCPTRHRCLISRNPSVESASRWILVSRIGTFLALFRLGAVAIFRGGSFAAAKTPRHRVRPIDPPPRPFTLNRALTLLTPGNRNRPLARFERSAQLLGRRRRG